MSRTLMTRTTTHRLAVTIAGATAAALLATAGTAHAATNAAPVNTVPEAAASSEEAAPELTAEQTEFINDHLGPELVAEMEQVLAQGNGEDPQVMALPVAAFVIGAAAWCARGAVASIPTSVLADVAKQKFSGKGEYAKNAIVGCLAGELGGVVWRFMPKKNAIVAAVAAFIIKYIR